MFHPVMSASLQDIQKSVQVTFQISVRIANGIAYPGLCCQVHHLVKLLLFKQFEQSLFVLYAQTDKLIVGKQGTLKSRAIVANPLR